MKAKKLFQILHDAQIPHSVILSDPTVKFSKTYHGGLQNVFIIVDEMASMMFDVLGISYKYEKVNKKHLLIVDMNEKGVSEFNRQILKYNPFKISWDAVAYELKGQKPFKDTFKG